ncbi:MAG: 6-bladed beta-propeller [Longimicrobiales bacterium]
MLLQKLPMVVRDTRGSFYAVPKHFRNHEVIIYDSTGRFVKMLGRTGSGPGEYRTVAGLAIGVLDSIYLVHDRRRLSVFDRLGRFARGAEVARGLREELVVVGTDILAMNGWIPTPERAGHALHLADAKGNYIRGVGSENLADPPGPTPRMFGVGEQSTLWIAETNNYRIEQVDSTGRVLRVIGIVPPPSWHTGLIINDSAAMVSRQKRFVDVTEAVLKRPQHLVFPPPFEVASIYSPGQGQLWVVLHIAVSDWNAVEVSYDPGTSEVVQSEDMLQRQYQTVIDVLDVQSGSLIARHFQPGYGSLLNDGTFIHKFYDQEGIVRMEAFRLRLIRTL